ncbi:translation initiation factor IF-2-like [Canis lupus familiaris]|uniref:translation initiation factor IF-2-like n=1 Tax=Canis lupus familiaris TaxID=9615 RepID=UPI0018F58EED|nr:translation initiation factor IF-2-like [Canis lupus familiaris]
MDTKKPAPKEALGEILGNFRKYLYLESTSQNYNGKGSFKTLGEVTEATPRRREGSARPGPAPPVSGNTSPRGAAALASREKPLRKPLAHLRPRPRSRAPTSPRRDRAAGSAGTRRAASGPALQAARSPRTPPRGRVAAQPTACSAPALPPGALGGASWGLRAEEEELRGPGGPEESEPAAGVAGAGPPQSPGGLVPGRGGGAHRLLRWQGLQLRRMRELESDRTQAP